MLLRFSFYVFSLCCIFLSASYASVSAPKTFDNRRQPLSSIGLLLTPSHQCTAILVNDIMVMTAKSCLINPNTQTVFDPNHITFFAGGQDGYYTAKSTGKAIAISSFATPASYGGDSSFGIVVLARPLSTQTGGVLTIASTPTPARSPVILVGYTSTSSTPYQFSCQYASDNSSLGFMRCPTGISLTAGSLVLSQNVDGGYTLLGLYDSLGMSSGLYSFISASVFYKKINDLKASLDSKKTMDSTIP